jgi:predicted DNA-binding protein (UPF0251 family)
METTMLKLKPEILSKNGKKQFVVLTYEEFEAIREQLEDAEDLKALRVAKRREGRARTVPLAAVKRMLTARKG